MKKSIQLNTIHGFLISLFATLLIGFSLMNIQQRTIEPLMISNYRPELIAVNLDDYEKKTFEKEEIQKEAILNKRKSINSNNLKEIEGTKKVAGKFEAIDDKLLEKEVEIATFEESGYMTSNIGNLENLKDLFAASKIDISTKEIKDQSSRKEVSIFEVEKSPKVDLDELQRNIVYPNLALKANIEGKVVVEVLVNHQGKPIECNVIFSSNPLFDEEAIKAIMLTNFEPALQNGYAVNCRINIPISFKLR
jgi:TonB family protein